MSVVKPRVLLAGGFEPSGRMGLLADAEAVRAAGGIPLLVATAVTAQGRRTFAWRAVTPALVAAQVRAGRELGPVRAVKLGMVPGMAQLRALRSALRGLRVPWVVDPVVSASSGGRLSRLSRGDYRRLAGGGVWLTPNADEAGWLLGEAPVRTVEEARSAARELMGDGFAGVAVKGGHLEEEKAIDVMATAAELRVVRSGRLHRRPEQRGTGCRFASTLATELAKGTAPFQAVRRAGAAVRAFLRRT
jgi:hydroxymethylpyrimidine/phosphomethylpyrimidine kinase